MDYSLLIAYLRQKQYITDLEKDILDTWNELQKNPFDRSAGAETGLRTTQSTRRFLLQSQRCQQRRLVPLNRQQIPIFVII